MNASSSFKLSHQFKSETKEPINTIQFDRTGKYILTGGNNRVVNLWNTDAKRHIQKFIGHSQEILDVSLSKDSQCFASCGKERTVILWDVVQAQALRRFHGHTQQVNAVNFNHSSSVLASASLDATVKIWDLRSFSKAPIQTLIDAKDSVLSVQITGANIISGSADGKMRIYDVRQGLLHTIDLEKPISYICPNSDLSLFLAASLDSRLNLIDPATGVCLHTFEGHINKVFQIKGCFGHKDKYVISGSENGEIYIWLKDDPTCFSTVVHQLNHVVSQIAFSPTSCSMASVGSDGNIDIWHELVQ